METGMSESQEISASILFVDDEANILSSLKRLFRPLGYRIHTAESGEEGLEIMARENVDLVVSDMRMPEMNGAQFLEKVRERWPDTVRILLTGYAEINATIDAINKGHVYRYVSKPWEDSDLMLIVKQALQHKMLEREKQRLEELAHKQNEELKQLNASLETKVTARTNELKQTMQFLEAANEQLKRSFITSVRVFSNLIEMRYPGKTGHARRVAELARNMAKRMGMNEAEVQDTFIAGLLLDIGKVGLPDRLHNKPYSTMSAEDRAELSKFPIRGQTALMPLDQLQGAAKLIRSYRERFDGAGFPDHIAGMNIPLGSRILSVASDYDTAMIGTEYTKPLKNVDALLLIQDGKNTRYDAMVVDALIQEFGAAGSNPVSSDIPLRSGQLLQGMVIAHDLLSHTGEMLLSKAHVLTELNIEQIRVFERMGGHPLSIYVHSHK
jgi:response regulator RpfG family c-di-GMP phosphodiesterase